jgi:hypothetical protein
VDKAQLNIETLIHNADHEDVISVASGSVVHDTATVSGAVSGFDIGAISFTLNSAAVDNDPAADGTATARSVDSAPLAVGSYTYKAHVEGNTNYKGADSADEPLSVTSTEQFFCSPGFWKNAEDAAWDLTGYAKTDLFNGNVTPAYYDTLLDPALTLGMVVAGSAHTYGGDAGPFGLDPFNATGAFLTNAAGFYNNGSKVDNCPIDHHGNIINP